MRVVVTHNDEYSDSTFAIEEDRHCIVYDVVYHFGDKTPTHPDPLTYLVNYVPLPDEVLYRDLVVTDKGHFTLSERTGEGCQATSEEVAKVFAQHNGERVLWVTGANSAFKNPEQYAAKIRKKRAMRV